jgi:hypothetical protein
MMCKKATPLPLQTTLVRISSKNDAVKRENDIGNVASVRSRKPGSRVPPGVSRAKNLQLQKTMPSLRNDTKGATIVHLSFHRKPRKSKPDTD